jgi:hypothetical protein
MCDLMRALTCSELAMMRFYANNMGKYGRHFLTVLIGSGFNLCSELDFSGNISK